MDVLFAKEAAAEVIGDEHMFDQTKKEHLFRLELARKALRKTQGEIETQVAKEIQSAQEKGETADLPEMVQRVCAKQKPQEGVNGYFYTKLAEGRDYDSVADLICGPDLSKKISQETGSMKQQEDRKTLHDIPTNINGVTGEIPSWTKSYGSPWIHFGVVFAQDAVLRIAQSSELPPFE